MKPLRFLLHRASRHPEPPAAAGGTATGTGSVCRRRRPRWALYLLWLALGAAALMALSAPARRAFWISLFLVDRLLRQRV